MTGRHLALFTLLTVAACLPVARLFADEPEKPAAEPPSAPAAHTAFARAAPDTFLISDPGSALLGRDGKEIERLDGELSPDGHWVVFAGPKADLIIQSRTNPEERTAVPLVSGSAGSRPLWLPDSKQILVRIRGPAEAAFFTYDMRTKELTKSKLPTDAFPDDWSPDGKRVLMTLAVHRVAWINVDGTGEPEFVTSELEVAGGARLSPDGRSVLCIAGFHRPDPKDRQLRLCIIDLTTRTRSFVDEPGVTQGYCWSPDGSKVAYTWQRALEKPTLMRETFLITCNADGSERKTVTSRKYDVPETSAERNVIFFRVLEWR